MKDLAEVANEHYKPRPKGFFKSVQGWYKVFEIHEAHL
jgi:hypothetical protein